MTETARQETAPVAARLLDWYDRHRRVMPWRALPGEPADPYKVWLSEIMLQQTTVAAVGPYFQTFLARWPRVEDLAAAPLDDVLTAWAGLGYYARARNLHRCAKVVAEDFNGRFPTTEPELLALPGIGPYTAAAIAAIAFDRVATVVDGNVERVVARLFALETPLPTAKAELRRLAESLTPDQRPGDYAQAMMDLGATVCLPRRPKCLICPLSTDCAAQAAGIAETLPRRAPKPERPLRRGVAFWLLSPEGTVLLRRRPEKGLLGGMMEVPSTDWREADWPAAEARRQAPRKTRWSALPGLVRHGFTHFELELEVWTGRAAGDGGNDGGNDGERWVALDALHDQALPTLMRKVVRHSLKHLADR